MRVRMCVCGRELHPASSDSEQFFEHKSTALHKHMGGRRSTTRKTFLCMCVQSCVLMDSKNELVSWTVSF